MNDEIACRPCSFELTIIRLDHAHDLPGSWGEADFRSVLEALEFGDAQAVAAQEVEDMAIMALQDLKPDDAAEVVLKLRAGDRLSAGQIQNLAHELQDEPMWEEFPDMAAHECIFVCASLLCRAFPDAFLAPEMSELELRVQPGAAAGPGAMERVLEERWLLRLLAQIMEEGSLLGRMFEVQLAGGDFPEAEALLWAVEARDAPGHLLLRTSSYWLRGLPDEGSYSLMLNWPVCQ